MLIFTLVLSSFGFSTMIVHRPFDRDAAFARLEARAAIPAALKNGPEPQRLPRTLTHNVVTNSPIARSNDIADKDAADDVDNGDDNERSAVEGDDSASDASDDGADSGEEDSEGSTDDHTSRIRKRPFSSIDPNPDNSNKESGDENSEASEDSVIRPTKKKQRLERQDACHHCGRQS
jgi:hypothetical protein